MLKVIGIWNTILSVCGANSGGNATERGRQNDLGGNIKTKIAIEEA